MRRWIGIWLLVVGLAACSSSDDATMGDLVAARSADASPEGLVAATGGAYSQATDAATGGAYSQATDAATGGASASTDAALPVASGGAGGGSGGHWQATGGSASTGGTMASGGVPTAEGGTTSSSGGAPSGGGATGGSGGKDSTSNPSTCSYVGLVDGETGASVSSAMALCKCQTVSAWSCNEGAKFREFIDTQYLGINFWCDGNPLGTWDSSHCADARAELKAYCCAP